MISRPGDVLPPGFLTEYLNMTANKTGFIESRAGTAKVSDTPLSGPIHSQGRIIIDGQAYIYQGSGQSLYRAFSEIWQGFSGNPLVMKDGGPDLAILPSLLVFDSAERVKDNGFTTTNFGIAGPIAAASPLNIPALSKVIDEFDYGSTALLLAVWTPTNITLTRSTVSPFSGSACANLDVTSLTEGSMIGALTVDLSQFSSPGDSTDADFISFYMRLQNTDSLASCESITLKFDVDPTTNDFAHNYYYITFLQGEMPTVINTWIQLKARKSEFTRAGADPNDWANVKKVQFVVSVAPGSAFDTLVGIDSLKMLSGVDLNSGAYDWIYRYKSQLTGSTSPFSPIMFSTFTVVNGSTTITVVNPRDPQVTHIELYRRGGDNSIFEFVSSTLVTAYTGTSDIVDNSPDSALGDTTDLTQIEMSNLSNPYSAVSTSVLLTTNSGGTFTDYTVAVGDQDQSTYAVLDSFPTQLAGGGLVIGANQPFRKILVVFDANVNTNISSLAVQYWNGTSFQLVQGVVDGTSVGGATLNQNGIISFDFPDDWAPQNLNGNIDYFALLTVSATLSATVHITEIRISANAFDPTVGEVFGGRVWMDDSHHTDRVWYSDRFNVEVFFANNFIVGATSGDPVIRPYGLDDQLFIFTSKSVDRVVGSSPGSFQPIATGSEVGLFSKYAICKGQGRIYYRAYDGIYALPGSGFSTKLTLAIDPIFHGLAGGGADELQPVNNNFALTETMEFFDSKLRFGYTATNSNRYEIIYDLETDRYEMTDIGPTSYLRLDDIGQIYSGNSDGFVRQLETGNRDGGAAIDIKFRTAYIDFGSQSQTKQFTEILIDCDLVGQTLDFYSDLDNGLGTTQHVAVTNATRSPVYFPLDDDTQARNIALRLDSNNGGLRVKFYKITFFYIILPTELTLLPTDWDDMGYPADKRLNQLQLDIDTRGSDVSVDVQVDSTTVETLTVNTARRLIVPFSLAANTIGKLVRLIFRGTTGFRYFKHLFDFLKDPLQETRYDTYWLDFGYTRWKFIRRVWVASNTPAVVTMEIQIDNESRYTTTFEVAAGTGWMKTELILPSGLKGMLFRFIFTSDSAFKIFLDQSDVEWHPLADQRGYERARMALDR